MDNTSDRRDIQIFENSEPQGGNPTYYFLGGVGLIGVAIVGFVAALGIDRGPMMLHIMTSVPTLAAIGLLARGFSLRKLPSRIVVGPEVLEITTDGFASRYAWAEIGSAAKANVSISQKSCLRITDTAGKMIAQIDESFPEFQRLVTLVESHVDAKLDDTSVRLMARKAHRTGISTFVLGCVLATSAVFIALSAREEQRAEALLSAKGVPGEAEIVERLTAPDGKTRRIKYSIAGSQVKNVEVHPVTWFLLEHAQTVPVIYVPDEPDISRLEAGEVKRKDFKEFPGGEYVAAGLAGLMALFVFCYSPLAWMGYDVAFDGNTRIWKLKRYGRVFWTSR